MSVARDYFASIAADDLEAAAAAWASGCRARVLGAGELEAPSGLFELLGAVRRGFPDLALDLAETFEHGERAAAVWRITGTFSGEPVRDVAPTGARLDCEFCDVIRVREGKVDRSSVIFDGALVAAQLGTHVSAVAGDPEPVADGVWVLRGGYPLRAMNVYLIADDGGFALFDSGTRAMAGAISDAAERLGGGITRVILGHAHSDHRGSASALDVPVLCHHRERDDAEGDGGLHYMPLDALALPARWVMPSLMRSYDGPAPQIAGVLSEGDEPVPGFSVIDLPGHAPGLIGLWREHDRLALVSDCYYETDVDAMGKPGPPRVPHRATSLDVAQAADSIRRLAARQPSAVWPGHMGPLTGDVRGRLEQAADR